VTLLVISLRYDGGFAKLDGIGSDAELLEVFLSRLPPLAKLGERFGDVLASGQHVDLDPYELGLPLQFHAAMPGHGTGAKALSPLCGSPTTKNCQRQGCQASTITRHDKVLVATRLVSG
jgi:hypothetical protein